ncbi:unnamed protein product [Chrysodeixis includens]|uniref:Uncharacterized protein n=1 Tax=Chrysodeixis includens TaxID=689277 RepID=A0A9N8KVI7_CHRIL|nr:unnamed protein product [Chrysodeixis includens]
MDLQKIAGKREFNFSKYLKRFEPRTVWEHLDKQRKYHGLQITDEQQTQLMCTLMDPADEILKLKVQNGDPKMVLDMSGRRGWTPPKGLNKYDKDRFYIRRRIYELMKQAIYQTRNKMVIMQIYREKYSFTALYRMGFLMNKADNAAKLFGMFSFRLFKGCLLSRENLGRLPIRDLMSGHERQLSHLFNLELLVDVIKKNDETCKEIFANQTSGRTAAFNNKFVS